MQITVHKTPTKLLGKELFIGKEAPAARITKLDGTANVIGMIAPSIQLLIAIPSLKTEVCSLGAKKFNTLLKKIKGVSAVMVTTDDAEFLKGYKEAQGIDGAEIVIDEERHFAKKYGILIGEGKLKNRLARAVFLIDKEGKVAYKEIVPEIVDEVDYDACLQALTDLLNEKRKGHTHENWMSL
ncbi:redoxin family protein [Sulfurimonas sp. HSL-1716]|uniref:redoxin family protein n=1 Tax=Hydrocurvibacter sulfurireducens TaxID=3131937 RepID=UPI0031F98B53